MPLTACLPVCLSLPDPAIFQLWSADQITPLHLTNLQHYTLTFGVATMSFLLAVVVFLLVRTTSSRLQRTTLLARQTCLTRTLASFVTPLHAPAPRSRSRSVT